MSILLKAVKRNNLQHSSTRGLREEGYFPAVTYGKEINSQPIAINTVDYIKAIREAGRNGILALDIEGGDKLEVMLQDIQVDALKGDILHADFVVVDLTSEVEVDVTVNIEGEAKGVKDGGVLQQPLHDLSIRALPGDIPEYITVNVDGLEIGDSIQVSDIKAGNYEFTHDPNEVILTILPPTKEEEEETPQEEPTVVGQEDQQEEDVEENK